MKKSIFTALLIVMLVGLVGCGENTPTPVLSPFPPSVTVGSPTPGQLETPLPLTPPPSFNAVQLTYTLTDTKPFARMVFFHAWNRTDGLIAGNTSKSIKVWGDIISGDIHEPYSSAPNGVRVVQYFTKGRMELTQPYGDPADPNAVTFGPIVNEMLSGKNITGDSQFALIQPPMIPLYGDDSPNTPTYDSLKGVYAQGKVAEQKGGTADQAIDRDGKISTYADAGKAEGAKFALFDNTSGHNIPRAFVDWWQTGGIVIGKNNRTAYEQLVDPNLLLGTPLTEAYWIKVMLKGQETMVLMQPYQKRVLVYIPSQPNGNNVDLANTGIHYVTWRYGAPTKVKSADAPFPLKGPHVGYGFNVQLFYQDKKKVLDEVQGAGFTWLKQQVSWSDIEGKKGQHNWDELDRVVMAVAERNLHLTFTISRSPAWATADGGTGLPKDKKDLNAFVAAVAERYKGRVDAYEIWNEENLGVETSNQINVQTYAFMLNAAFKGVKQVDPFAFVIFGGLTPTGTNDGKTAVDDAVYLKDIYELNNGSVKNSFDVLGAHPGSQDNPPDTLFPEKPGPDPKYQNQPSFYFRRIEQLHAIMVKYNDKDKQMWLTEFGWDSQTNPPANYEYAKNNTEQQQAQYIVAAYKMGKDNYDWMGVMHLWNLNFSTLPGLAANDEKIGWAVLRPDSSPRPAYDALKSMPK